MSSYEAQVKSRKAQPALSPIQCSSWAFALQYTVPRRRPPRAYTGGPSLALRLAGGLHRPSPRRGLGASLALTARAHTASATERGPAGATMSIRRPFRYYSAPGPRSVADWLATATGGPWALAGPGAGGSRTGPRTPAPSRGLGATASSSLGATASSSLGGWARPSAGRSPISSSRILVTSS